MSLISRRSLLRGLGLGAGVTLVSPLVARMVRAGDEPPRRFVFVLEGNGFEPITMLSTAARAALNPTLRAPLDPGARWWPRSYRHASALTVPSSGLETAPALGALAMNPAVAAQSAVVLGMSSRVAGGGHSGMHGVLASARTIARVPGGPTIDAYLGSLAAVRQDAPYDVVRVGVSGSNDPLDFGTCAFAARRPAPLILQPRAAFNALFGSVGDEQGRTSFARRRGLLDFARADVNVALRSFSGNSSERAKLESYLTSVEELVRRHERVGTLRARLEGARPESPDTNALYRGADPLVAYRAQLQVVTAALKGGLTNVAVIGCGTGGAFGLTYSSLSQIDRHQLHHISGSDANARRIIHEVTRIQVDAIVQMAADLAATPEVGGDGTMLDHTVIVFIGDNGEQHHSNAEDFPTLLLGGRGMGLAARGQTVIYPGLSGAGHRQVSNLWNTLGHLAGESLDEFGKEGAERKARGPLSELMG